MLDGTETLAELERRPREHRRHRGPGSTGCGPRRSRSCATRPSCSSAVGARATHLSSSCRTRRSAGFRLLPAPDRGDVWLDLEGHPFYETARGIEYLFGYCYRDDVRRRPLRGAVGARPRGRARGASSGSSTGSSSAVAAIPAPARLPLRRLRAHRAHAADGRARDARARGRRLPARRGARRPLPRRQAGAPGLDRELLDQGDRGALRVRAHRDGEGRRRRRWSLFEEWLESGDDAILEEVERYNEEDCRSTFELHEWLLAIRPDGRSLAATAGAATAHRGGGGARRTSGRLSRRAARAVSRRGRRGGSLRISSTTTSARRGRSGGSGSAGRSSTTTS